MFGREKWPLETQNNNENHSDIAILEYHSRVYVPQCALTRTDIRIMCSLKVKGRDDVSTFAARAGVLTTALLAHTDSGALVLQER